ncbi:MAG: phosphate acyltransferase PlsX [Acidobacteria bacterium]|nr:phosphate acyltransferase PlsX [Acidobacteriota bacterium]
MPSDSSSQTNSIVVDAMGSDNAPYSEIEGVVQAVREFPLKAIIVGREELIRKVLRQHDVRGLPIRIVDASEVITMDEPVSTAARKKKDSSLHVACRLIREGQAHGLVSAGNTGAIMAISKLVMGMLESVDRPALAAVLPTKNGACVLIDVGANVDCKPHQMVQFAIMGHIYSKCILRKSKPSVGLMSIGEEQSKGNELTKEVYKILSNSNLHFVGNVEGRDVYDGKTDVIVCDGFTGNVALKISEGLIEVALTLLKEELSRNWTSKVGALLAHQSFRALKRKLDYTEYGGAPLLGVRGVTIICHGSSNANAIKNAMRVANEFCAMKVNERIEKEISSFSIG